MAPELTTRDDAPAVPSLRTLDQSGNSAASAGRVASVETAVATHTAQLTSLTSRVAALEALRPVESATDPAVPVHGAWVVTA